MSDGRVHSSSGSEARHRCGGPTSISPPSALREAVDQHGGPDAYPPWEWAELDECSFQSWYDESGRD